MLEGGLRRLSFADGGSFSLGYFSLPTTCATATSTSGGNKGCFMLQVSPVLDLEQNSNKGEATTSIAEANNKDSQELPGRSREQPLSRMPLPESEVRNVDVLNAPGTCQAAVHGLLAKRDDGDAFPLLFLSSRSQKASQRLCSQQSLCVCPGPVPWSIPSLGPGLQGHRRRHEGPRRVAETDNP